MQFIEIWSQSVKHEIHFMLCSKHIILISYLFIFYPIIFDIHVMFFIRTKWLRSAH